MTPAEKRLYLSLAPEAQQRFQENFWEGKSISAEDYYRRLQYVDSQFGSTKIASGANTDPGRVYLSLGPPDRVTHLPSSRIFAPLEIWYYHTVPALRLETELRLIFYQKNSLGLLKLYSPTIDTIRTLLLPQSSTVSMFGPNDDLTESDIRRNLDAGPVEDEVITAAVGVADGIKHTGNDEILGRIVSPSFMLDKKQRTAVESRFIGARPQLEVVQSPSPYAGRQIDFLLNTSASREIDIDVLSAGLSLYQNQLHIKGQQPRQWQYAHRLDLLPGMYTVIFTVDGKAFPYPLTVPRQPSLGEILRVSESGIDSRTHTPLSFGGKAFTVSESGASALVTLPAPGEVVWTLRKNIQVLSKTQVQASDASTFPIPTNLEPGLYDLEASYDGVSRTVQFTAAPPGRPSRDPTLLSFNANLYPALRWSFLGHQWLLQNNVAAARRCLESSLAAGVTKEAQVELARADALAGHWDAARTRVRQILAAHPNDFDALSVFAYIETKLQDYPVAAQLYRRALAVKDSPALRAALSSLPPTGMAN